MRQQYRQFWDNLSDELRGSGDEDKHGSQGLDILDILVNILTSLSSIYVVSIRDAANEAVLCIARSIRKGCVDLRSRINTCQRQLTAEKSANGARYQAIVKNKSRIEKVCNSNNSVVLYMKEVLLHITNILLLYYCY